MSSDVNYDGYRWIQNGCYKQRGILKLLYYKCKECRNGCLVTKKVNVITQETIYNEQKHTHGKKVFTDYEETRVDSITFMKKKTLPIYIPVVTTSSRKIVFKDDANHKFQLYAKKRLKNKAIRKYFRCTVPICNCKKYVETKTGCKPNTVYLNSVAHPNVK